MTSLAVLLLTALVGSLAAGITPTDKAGAVGAQAAKPSTTSANTDFGGTAIEAFEPAVAARAWNAIVLHHSATRGGNVAAIDAVHRRQKDSAGKAWLGIGYHFVIGNGQNMGDGEIQATFRWRDQLPGAHAGTRALNEHGIGICLIGNFDEATPTAKQLEAVGGLTRWLARRFEIGRTRLLRHSDAQATLCPGRLFPWERLVGELPL